MKSVFAIIAVLLLTQVSQASDRVACTMASKSLNTSPLITLDSDSGSPQITIYKGNEAQYGTELLKATNVTDESDDVYYSFTSPEVSLNWYGDETDAMGLMEGHITSKVLNGRVKCTYLNW